MIPVDPDPYKDTRAGLTVLRVSHPVLGSFLDHFEQLLAWQARIGPAFKPDLAAIDADLCHERMAAGRPCLSAEDIKIEPNGFDRLVRQIADSIMPPDGAAASSTASVADGDRSGLVRGLLQRKAGPIEAAARRYGMPLDLFAYSAHQALIPFMEVYAAHLRPLIAGAAWLRGCCPVCGGLPLMGRLEGEGGRRILLCTMCRHQWDFKRVECPFCGNGDQQTMRYFYDETDPQRRVDLCEKCKGYLKVVDGRAMVRAQHLLVEDVATLHLDVIARRQGFGGPGLYPFGDLPGRS
ncbi:MAG: formate dehydrogenase accessory protein FdhE [Planctomycetota bacterium]